MIGVPSNARVWIATGVTDMRCGFNSLACKVESVLEKGPFSGRIFLFRGRRGALLKALYWTRGDEKNESALTWPSLSGRRHQLCGSLALSVSVESARHRRAAI
ncbi:putative transposase [Pandoraea sp. SD6-2]|nr:putative transposase [Pandoraea sp. SD6-2]